MLDNGITNRVTVLMVNYRSAEHVESCLKSLENENIDRVVVLENGSGGEEWERLKAAVVPWSNRVSLMCSDKNLGFGAGVNLASKQIDPSYTGLIWILNPDTIVSKGCAASLAASVVNGFADIVSPVIATGSQTEPTVWYAGGDFDHRSGCTRHTGFGNPLPYGNGVTSTSFMTGAAPMMSFDTWNRLGGFKEHLFLYWEDADLSLRAHELRLTMGVNLSAHIWHKEGGSGGTAGRSESYYFYMHRNRLIIESPYSSLWGLVIGPGIFETVRLTLRALRETDDKIGKLIASLRGIRAGIREVLNPTENQLATNSRATK